MNYYLPHIAITVSDIQQTKEFYTKIGFVVKEDMYSDEKKRHFLLLEGYGLEMEVFNFDSQTPNQTYSTEYHIVGPQHIAFPVKIWEKRKSNCLRMEYLF